MRVALLGATSAVGRLLTSRLIEAGYAVTAVGRDANRLASVDTRAKKRLADLDSVAAARAGLEDAEAVISLADARYVPNLMRAAPERVARMILTGSTRKFTRFTDPAADAVRNAEWAFRQSGVPGVMLHPTAIFGPGDRGDIGRLLRLLARWPRAVPLPLPLPRAGRVTVQPVFIDDAVDAYLAALQRDEAPGEAIILAGQRPVTYRFVAETCAGAMGRRVRPVAAPMGVLKAAGWMFGFTRGEIDRASEDKAFDISELRARLNVRPRPFADGLRETVARSWGAGGKPAGRPAKR